MISMIKKIPFYALVIKGGDAAAMGGGGGPDTTMAGGAAAAVVSHGAINAHFVRSSGEHVKVGDVGKVIANYNLLVDEPGSLNTIKDPYMLTLYLIVCDVSLRKDGEEHKPLNTACERVSEESGRRVHEKLAQSLAHAQQAPASADAAAAAVAGGSELPSGPPISSGGDVGGLDASAATLEHHTGLTPPAAAPARRRRIADVTPTGAAAPAEEPATPIGMRIAIMDAWNSPDHGRDIAQLPEFVHQARDVLAASGDSPVFDNAFDPQQHWDLCKTLARNIRGGAFSFGRKLLGDVCLEMPLKFLDSSERWKQGLEFFLFHAMTDERRPDKKAVTVTSPMSLRAEIMRTWNTLKTSSEIESDNWLIQDAIWLLYTNDRFSKITHSWMKSSDEHHKELCKELVSAASSRYGSQFFRSKGESGEVLINYLCGDKL